MRWEIVEIKGPDPRVSPNAGYWQVGMRNTVTGEEKVRYYKRATYRDELAIFQAHAKRFAGWDEAKTGGFFDGET